MEEPNDIKRLIDTAINEVNNKYTYSTTTLNEEYVLSTLPDDFFYEVKSVIGTEQRWKTQVVTDINTTESLDKWIEAYAQHNNISVKIKTKKTPTSGYKVQNYYRCQHNTRNWSPNKDPQKKLELNPSARVKNTNCPFQLNVKIGTEGCCAIDIEWEHNHSVDTLEASNFSCLSQQCTEKVLSLFEKGYTPAIARQHFLKELKESCEDDLDFHKKKANRGIMPRRRDFSYLYSQFGKDRYGGQGSLMFERLSEKLAQYQAENPEATTCHQIYEGAGKPLIIGIVTPLMKRVHKEVQQSGELVFVDSTSNTEEHNLKVFVMCTHSVSGALPLGILITSDEQENTLKQGFEMLRSCLPLHAFNGRGRDQGPQVIITDNCKEERSALRSVWPSSSLLLCIFHMLQQLWKWLHEGCHKIIQTDRPHILNLFKKSLYAQTEEEFDNSFSALLNDERCKRYPNLLSYLHNLLKEKEAFALCFRAELPVRGNHTNNFVEAQFLVLKDVILHRTKEYNVVGLLEKLTIDLEDHYKNKLLSIADGSYDGLYRHRFMGKGKDGGTGFKVPDKKQMDAYLATVRDFGNNIFGVGSASDTSQSHTVDMSLGVCSCQTGKDGTPCKHQYVLWAANVAHCINFIPVANADSRQKLAWIALGKTLPLDCYNALRSCDAGGQTEPAQANCLLSEPSVGMSHSESNTSTPLEIENPDSPDDVIENAQQLLQTSYLQILQKLQTTRDLNLAKGIIKFSKRVESLSSARAMQSNLVSALYNFGASEIKKTGTGKKIRVQPNRKRKSGNGSRQAVSKGRPVQLHGPASKRKRTHDLSTAVLANTNSSKKSGTHTMQSKTKQAKK